MLGSVGSVVPKRWILGIFALGLIAVMVATSANPWAGASSLPTSVTATPLTPTSIQVDWTAADGTSTLPESGAIVDGYRVDCVPTSGTTATKSVTGRTTATATLTTNVVADTTYVCSVFSSSNTTLPSTGVPASSIKTPLSLAKQLGSVVASPTSGNVQVDGSLLLSAVSKGADTSKTAITGLTVNWSIVSGGGSVDASTGDSVTYTATSAGSVVVKAEVTQSATGVDQPPHERADALPALEVDVKSATTITAATTTTGRPGPGRHSRPNGFHRHDHRLARHRRYRRCRHRRRIGCCRRSAVHWRQTGSRGVWHRRQDRPH